MVPKERVDSTDQKRLPANEHAHHDVFQAFPVSFSAWFLIEQVRKQCTADHFMQTGTVLGTTAYKYN